MDQETDSHTFQTELRRAMLSAANRQRARLVDALRLAADDHVERARARGAAESDGLRGLAEDDVEGIQAWADTELARIGAEATRRTEERQRDLADALEQHAALVEAELDSVAEAVRAHHATLDALFEDISAASDPAYIARRARSVPPRLDLDARGNETTEPDATIADVTPDGPEAELPPDSASAVAVTERASITAISALRVAGQRTMETPVDPVNESSGEPESTGNVALRLLRSITGLGSQETVGPGEHQEQPR